MDEYRTRYFDIKQMVQRELWDEEMVYVNVRESGNNTPFWKYVRSHKQKAFGISSLKCNVNVVTDSCLVLNAPKLNLYTFLKMVFSCY